MIRAAAVRRIAIEKRGVTPRPTRAGYLARSQPAPPRPFLPDWQARLDGRLSLPAVYEFTQFTTGTAVADQLDAFRKNFARANLSDARRRT